MERTNIVTCIRLGSAVTLIVYPLLLIAAFALHFNSLSDFLDFKLVYQQKSAETFMSTLNGPDGFRLFLLPHYIGYIAMPFMLLTTFILAKLIFPQRPRHALIGAGLALFGIIYLSGVFASWLSFSAVVNVEPGLINSATQVLKALTTMQGPLLFSTSLSILSLVGMLVLGFGMLKTGIAPNWAVWSFILGNLLIILFMDLDNWMLLGGLCMFIGLLPISIKIMHKRLQLAHSVDAR